MYTINLSEEQLTYVVNLLMDKPLRETFELFNGIQTQVRAQLEARQSNQTEPPSDPEPKKK